VTELRAAQKVWSLLTVDESSRQFAGNRGYADELGVRYSYDSKVPNSRGPVAGDLAVLRDDEYVLGLGWLDTVVSNPGSKERLRCPICHTTALKERKTLAPRFRCECGATFATPDSEKLTSTSTRPTTRGHGVRLTERFV
jgi:hypothetical protein